MCICELAKREFEFIDTQDRNVGICENTLPSRVAISTASDP